MLCQVRKCTRAMIFTVTFIVLTHTIRPQIVAQGEILFNSNPNIPAGVKMGYKKKSFSRLGNALGDGKKAKFCYFSRNTCLRRLILQLF